MIAHLLSAAIDHMTWRVAIKAVLIAALVVALWVVFR